MIHELILKISHNIINELSDDINKGFYSSTDDLVLSAHLEDLLVIAKEDHDKSTLAIVKQASNEAYHDNINTVIKILKRLF